MKSLIIVNVVWKGTGVLFDSVHSLSLVGKVPGQVYQALVKELSLKYTPKPLYFRSFLDTLLRGEPAKGAS